MYMAQRETEIVIIKLIWKLQGSRPVSQLLKAAPSFS